MKKYIITEELANGLLNYIASKPYNESHQLVAGLQALETYEEPKEALPTKKK